VTWQNALARPDQASVVVVLFRAVVIGPVIAGRAAAVVVGPVVVGPVVVGAITAMVVGLRPVPSVVVVGARSRRRCSRGTSPRPLGSRWGSAIANAPREKTGEQHTREAPHERPYRLFTPRR
jgi:hypothetical protein